MLPAMTEPIRVIRWRNRPVVAYTDGPRHLRFAGVQCLDAHTRKRRVLRLAGMTACRLGIDGLIATELSATSLLTDDILRCLNQCRGALDGAKAVSIRLTAILMKQ